jgi:hypothetical protein
LEPSRNRENQEMQRPELHGWAQSTTAARSPSTPYVAMPSPRDFAAAHRNNSIAAAHRRRASQ